MSDAAQGQAGQFCPRFLTAAHPTHLGSYSLSAKVALALKDACRSSASQATERWYPHCTMRMAPSWVMR